MAKIKCILENYYNLAVSIPSEILEGSNMPTDKLVKIITKKYNRDNTRTVGFSLSKNLCTNPIEFEESIDKFIDRVVQELKDMGVIFKKDTLVSKLKSYYLSSNIPVNDDPENEADLQDAKVVSIDELKAIDLDNILDELFNENYAIKSHFILEFKHQIKDKTIIHRGETIKTSRIVYDIPTLNLSITEFMNELYRKITDYMNTNGIPMPKEVNNMFVLESKSVQYKINPGYIEILNAFYNYCINNHDYLDILEKNFHDKILGNKSNTSTLLDAVSAYIGIMYFDRILEKSLSKYIYVNEKLFAPITYKNGEPQYKYVINKNLNIRQGWHSEVSDGISEMGDFSVLSTETIPLKNKYGYLNKTDFIISFLKLRNLVQSITDTNSSLYQAAEMLAIRLDDREAWKIILLYIKNADKKAEKNDINAKVLLMGKSVKNHLISDNDWNIYVSVYDYLFDPGYYYGEDGKKHPTTPGVYYIELDSLKSNGNTDNYRITDSILGSLASTSDLNYSVFEYNNEKLRFEFKEKPKFYAGQNRFQIKFSVNKNARDIESADLKLKIYDFTPGETIFFKVGNKNFTIENDNKKNIYGVFGIDDSLDSFKIKSDDETINFKEYFKDLLYNLMYPTKRNAFIHNALEGKDLEFMSILKMFDHLFETNYSSNEIGLQEFRILYDLNNNAFDLLFLESAHSLYSLYINNEFAKNKGTQYTVKEIDKWISKQDFPFLKNIDKFEDSVKRKFIEERKDGNFLRGFSSNNLIDIMGDARTIISGDNNLSTIKDFSNNSIPNASVAFTDFKAEVKRLEEKDLEYRSKKREADPTYEGKTAAGHLLFAGNSNAIKTVVVDSEVKLADGSSKLVSRFTISELLYHAIYNKFFIIDNSKLWLSLPVTYSDKTKFLNLLVNIEKILGTDNVFKVKKSVFEEKILNTIGNYYKQIYKDAIEDYKKMFGLQNVSDDQVFSIVNLKIEQLNNTSENPFNDFVDMAYNAGVELFEDLHYRKGKAKENSSGEKVYTIESTNELLEFLVNDVYKDLATLNQMLEEEKLNFINLLLKDYVVFPVESIKDSINTNLKNSETNLKWITDKGVLILGKIITSEGEKTDIVVGNQVTLNRGEKLILNPIIETYFYMHNLIDNNAKLHFSGNELVHELKALQSIKAKALETLSIGERQAILKATGKSSISLADIVNISLKNKSIKAKVRPFLKQILSGEHSALFKRTVPIPGTMRLFDLGRIDGIASKYKVSVIQDVEADVYDLSGNYGYNKLKTIKAHDGSAWVTPFVSILENKSLSESECGNVKKPLWDIDEPKYGIRRLVKYASNAITNEIMRYRGSSINMYNLFKKMTNLRWNGLIDLTNWDVQGWNKFTFKNKVLKENKLYYLKGLRYYQIIDFGKTNGIYWTLEQEVDARGIALDAKSIIKYHSFDEDGKHYTTNDAVLHQNATHTIDSLFELHKVFGGINSASLINDNLILGEASNYVVVEFMNGVTYKTLAHLNILQEIQEGKLPQNTFIPVSLTYYHQPLKEALISVVINLSAIKNGASNINGVNTYYDNSKLKYSIFSTLKYGILLDADHDADLAQATEPSLVISSLDATGVYHDDVLEVYKALGRQTLKASDLEVKVTKEYIESLNPNNLDSSIQKEIKKVLGKETLENEDLLKFILGNPKNPATLQIQKNIREKFDGIYDVVGRIIINNIKKDLLGLTSTILNIIKSHFNLSDSHIDDEFKIPFSDPNIYGNIISTVSSLLNRKSIKRKYPGSGLVMVPSYGIYQTYETVLEDGTSQYLTGLDILKRAILWNNSLLNLSNTSTPYIDANEYDDIEEFNELVIQNYLNNNIKNDVVYSGVLTSTWSDQLSSINPSDNIIIKYQDINKDVYEYQVSLNSLKDYYDFTENPAIFLKKKRENALNIVSIEKNNRKPKDLASMKVIFTYVDEMGNERTINLFNTWIYRQLYNALKSSNLEEVSRIKKRLLGFVTKIDKNLYEQENGKNLQITKVTKKAAQIIQSYNYRTLFGIKEGDSLADIKEKGVEYFKELFNEYEPLNSDVYNYDFVVRNLNNKNNIYISIDGNVDSENSYTLKVLKWKTALKRLETVNIGKIVNRVYILSEDNRKMFEIARDIDVSDLYFYDKLQDVIKDNEGNVVKDKNIFKYKDNKILKRVEFLTQYQVFPTNRKAFIKYNIDRNALSSVLLEKGDEELHEKLDNAVYRLVLDIFKSDSYLFVLPAHRLRTSKYGLIKKIINKLSFDYKGTLLGDYFSNLEKYVFSRSVNSLKLDIIDLNVGHRPSKEELKLFNLEETEGDIFRILRANKRNFTPELIKAFNFLYERYNNSCLKNLTNIFIEKHSVERYNSFLKSLFVTSSRIPAQELLSFMLMETVGFAGVGSNVAAVSHFLMFLQGSDLDIDKSYIIGLLIDNNGRFLGWSDLFDLSTLENIEASETLTLPLGRKYVKDENGLVFKEELEYNIAKTRALLLIAIGKILKQLNKLDNLKLNVSDKLLAELNKHEATKLPIITEEDILKNYISSNILQLIHKSGNILAAYNPTDLDVLNSAKPESSFELNLFNPSTVPVMQCVNMTGKHVTGIAANGQRGQFMWRFQTIEGLKNGDNQYVDFDVTIDRVAREYETLPDGTIVEKVVPKTINTLPNIDTELVAKKLQLIAKVSPSSVLSQYITAATDNAKELILAVINSGDTMAKCHLYLASLGFDVADIVKFMTSPAIQFISELSNTNIFLNHSIKMKDIFKFIDNYSSGLAKVQTDKDLINLSKLSPKGSSIYLKDAIMSRLKSLYNEEFYKDILAFKNILAGSEEFSDYCRGLGMNLGVKTTKEGLTGFKNFLTSIVTNAESRKGIFEENTRKLKSNQTTFSPDEIIYFKEILDNGFDVDKWLSNQEYRDLSSNYYNKLKHTISVLYIYDHLPHFKSMFAIANVVNVIDGNLSIKSILFNKFLKELRNKYKFLPPKYEDKLLRAIDEVLIEDFISKLDFRISMLEGWKTLTKKFELENVNVSKELNVAENPSAFKFIFENYIIPMLKSVEDFKYNNFILNLVQTYDLSLDIPLYKVNIDLLKKDSSPELYLKYLDLIKGFRELKNYEYAGQSLTDWFILYNLIVNKNKYGSERLTTLFNDILKNDKKSLIFKQLKALGNSDYYKDNLNGLLKDVTLMDLLIKVAPTVSKDIGRLEPVLIVYDPVKGFVIKERKGFSYKEFVNLVIPIEGETLALQEERVIRLLLYGFGLVFSRYVKQMMQEIDTNVEVLNTLMLDKIFGYLINCQ